MKHIIKIFILTMAVGVFWWQTGNSQYVEATLQDGGAVFNTDDEFFDEKEYTNSISSNGYISSEGGNVSVIGGKSTGGTEFGKYNKNNTYVFSSSGTLTSLAGEKITNTKWKTILDNKQNSVHSEITKLASKSFESLLITGDLDDSEGVSFWETNFENHIQNSKERYVYFRLSTGAVTYYIRVDKTNTAQISATSAKIKEYKQAVLDGILAGGMSASYNVYKLHANNLVTLSNIVERKDDKVSIKSNSNIGYTAQYLLHPLFGKMAYEKIVGKNNTSTAKEWEKYRNSIKLVHADKDKLYLVMNSNYYSFLTDKDKDPFLTTAKNQSNVTIGGIQSFKTRTNKTIRPESLADTSLHFLYISELTKTKKDNTYGFDKNSLEVDEDYKYSIKDKQVYKRNGSGSYVKAFPLSDLGLEEKKLQVYSTTHNGMTYGGIISLEYKEMLYDPSTNIEYYTGRTIYMTGAFRQGMNAQAPEENKGLLEVTAPNDERTPVALKQYAFSEEGAYKLNSGHKAVNNPDTIVLNTKLVDPTIPSNKGKQAGIYIPINNKYSDNEDLKEYLKSDDVKKEPNVDVDAINSLITGEMDTEQQGLTYEEYLRVQEINEEFQEDKSNKVVEIVVKTSATIGWLLFFYSILLGLAYLIDRQNPFFEKSIFSFLLFNRVIAVANNDELAYYQGSYSDKRFLKATGVIVLIVILMVVSLLFIINNPIVDFILYFWDKYFEITG